MKPLTLTDAHAQVVAALQAGTVPVVSALDQDVARIGPAFVVGAPSATGVVVGGFCASWEYEVPVQVLSGTDLLDDLVGDADTAMSLLAAANLTTTNAAPTGLLRLDENLSTHSYTLTVAL